VCKVCAFSGSEVQNGTSLDWWIESSQRPHHPLFPVTQLGIRPPVLIRQQRNKERNMASAKVRALVDVDFAFLCKDNPEYASQVGQHQHDDRLQVLMTRMHTPTHTHTHTHTHACSLSLSLSISLSHVHTHKARYPRAHYYGHVYVHMCVCVCLCVCS